MLWFMQLGGAQWGIGAGEVLNIQVVDDAGEPVSAAHVRIANEDLRRRVNPKNGKWKGRTIYPSDSLPRTFTAGEVIELTAAAPGHLPRTIKYQVASRNNRVSIPLQSLAMTTPDRGVQIASASLMAMGRDNCDPGLVAAYAPGKMTLDPETIRQLGDLRHADPELTAGFSAMLAAQGLEHLDSALEWADIAANEAHQREGERFVELIDDLYRVRAVVHHVKWQQGEIAFLANPTPEAEAELNQHRRRSARIAAEWIQWADAAGTSTELPSALCVSAADRRSQCEWI